MNNRNQISVKSKYTILFVVFFLFLFSPLFASAATYTVCSSGCDETTIQAVFDNNDLAPADVVEVQADTPGGSKTYAELVTWGTNDVGDSDNQVILQGRSGDTITIDGEDTRAYAITQQSSGLSYITINNLTVTGGTTRNIWLEGAGTVSNGVTISNIISTGGAGGIWVRNASNATYSNITISGMSGTTGFTVSANGAVTSSMVDVSNITVTGGGTTGGGAIAIGSVQDLTISGDLTASNTATNGIGVSLGSLSGTTTLSSGATITTNTTDYWGVHIKDHTGGLAFDGIIDVNTTTNSKPGVKINNSTLGEGSYINKIDVDSASTGLDFGILSNLTIRQTISTNNTGSGIAVSGASSNLVFNSTNGQSEVSGNGWDGISNNDSASIIIENFIIKNNGGGGVPTAEGDGITGHDTSTTIARYNLIYDNDNTCFAFITDSNLTAYNNVCHSNGVAGGPRGQIWTNNDTGTIILKNNIVSEGLIYEIVAYDATALGTLTEDYNQFYHPADGNFSTTDNGSTVQADIAAWQSASSQDTNSNESDPLFASTTPTLPAGFLLQPLSPSIDAGTDVSLTTDYSGNSIYGLPDIGAYEYQPPYTVGTNNIPTTGSVRIYTDGKYRMKTASSTAVTADFNITPVGGSYQATTTQYMDITIDIWLTSGTYNKQWTATSTSGDFLTQATTTIHTINDLAASTYYQFKIDGTASSTAITGDTCNSNGSCLSDASGDLTFTYSGGYSTHTFALETDVTGPTSFTPSSPANGGRISSTKPTLSWNASSDSESGLSYYQLYIDGVLDTDNISGTSVSTANSLSCQNGNTWYVKAIDNAGNSTNSSTFSMTCASSSGTPASSPTTPENGYIFSITPNTVTDGNVTLNFEGGSDITKIAIADNSNFSPATYIDYASSTNWTIPQGKDTLYVKFCNKSAKCSETLSDTVVYQNNTDAITQPEIKSATQTTSNLTQEQTDAIINLLISFGAEQSVIDSVKISLQTKIVLPVFTRGLSRGMTHTDVKKLQQILNQDTDTKVAESGVGSVGNETNYFGSLTEKAVQKFQLKHSVVADTNDPGYGYVGPKTRAKLNEVFGE